MFGQGLDLLAEGPLVFLPVQVNPGKSDIVKWQCTYGGSLPTSLMKLKKYLEVQGTNKQYEK